MCKKIEYKTSSLLHKQVPEKYGSSFVVARSQRDITEMLQLHLPRNNN
jgi:hypothetical protein